MQDIYIFSGRNGPPSPKPCPNCSSQAHSFGQYPGSSFMFVQCVACKAMGPTVPEFGQEIAVSAWNDWASGAATRRGLAVQESAFHQSNK